MITRRAFGGLALGLMAAFPSFAAELDRSQATEIAKEAYVYGVPMVSVSTPEQIKARRRSKTRPLSAHA